MGIEPYLLRSGLRGVLCQRLFRQLCTCSTPDRSPEGALGLAVTDYRVPQGCSACRQTGYLGRQVLGEWLPLDQPEVRRELLARTAATEIAFQARAAGMVSLSERARQAVELGLVSPAEYRRVLGFDRELDS